MAARFSQAEIATKFAAAVAHSLHIEPELVTEDAYLDDLGAESLDLIQITMEAEESFDIWISEKSILQTAKQVYDPGELEKDGLLTEEGKTLLAARMPELDAAALAGDVTVASLNKHFMRVSGWLRMIEGLVEASPAACPQCGSAFASAVAYKRKCSQCGAESALPSGEDLNREWVKEFRSCQRGG